MVLVALAVAALPAAVPAVAHAGTWDPCTINGTDGNDVIQGTPGNDVICALGGNDVVYGNGGDDQILGGAGNDQLHGGDGADRIQGNTGNDTIWGDDNPAGTYDRLGGGPDDDTLYGGTGSDDLDGSQGSDVLSGGDGVDYVDYSYRTDDVTATIGGRGTDETPGKLDTIGSDVENLIGGLGNDTLTGNDGPNSLDGGPAGNDTLNGMGGDDFLDGGCQGSKNPCVYKKDADVLSGGAGYDIASYAPRADNLTLSIGDGANDGDRAAGERDDVRADVEEVRGGSGNDVLTGDANANVLDGNGGNDTLLGMGGNDTLQGDAGNDVFDGGAGADLDRAAGDPTFVDRLTVDAADTVRKDPKDTVK